MFTLVAPTFGADSFFIPSAFAGLLTSTAYSLHVFVVSAQLEYQCCTHTQSTLASLNYHSLGEILGRKKERERKSASTLSQNLFSLSFYRKLWIVAREHKYWARICIIELDLSERTNKKCTKEKDAGWEAASECDSESEKHRRSRVKAFWDFKLKISLKCWLSKRFKLSLRATPSDLSLKRLNKLEHSKWTQIQTQASQLAN